MTSKGFLRKLVIILLLTGFLLAGCSVDEPGSVAETGMGKTYPVDPVFKEFNSLLGGSSVLGPAISLREDHPGGVQCQYTERALMCYNPSAIGSQRFFLGPLGSELDIHADTHLVVTQSDADSRTVNGFIIYEKFLPLYDRLYGATYVGDPLTDLRINYDLNRVEQFFTNVGFYQSLDDPNSPVFLIPYGAYLCGGDCASRSNEYWILVKSNLVEQPFAESIARLGGSGIFGEPLLHPQVLDGMIRQVYTNVVFQAPEDDISQVSLVPLPGVLGYRGTPNEAKKMHDQLVFFMLDPATGLGHNVPKPFDLFLGLHGGIPLAGNPIQEVEQVQDQNLYQQCFENLCLFYDPAASSPLRVRLAPLGQEYIQKFKPEPDQEIQNYFTPDYINLVVSVDQANVKSTDAQQLRMVVLDRATMQGIARVEATALLTAEGQSPLRINFPPTDANGISLVVVPPQTELANGTRVQYQVCLNLPSEQPICRTDSYLIWNSR